MLAAQLLCLVRAIAPVLPHMAEDAWSHLPFSFHLDNGSLAETVFEAAWPKVDARWLSVSEEDLSLWSALLQVLLSATDAIQTLLISNRGVCACQYSLISVLRDM